MDLSQLALPLLGAIFLTAAAIVWLAGARLAHYVDAIADKTGVGKAFMGMLLLGGITSLPEVAAVSTSAAIGNAPMAVNNLLGTASINLLLLAVADLLFCREALTSVAARPGTLMQGVLTMTLGTAVAMLVTIGDIPVLGVGFGTTALLLGCIYALRLAARFERRHVWEVVSLDRKRDREEEAGSTSRLEERSLRHLALATTGCALVILVGGFFLSTSADAFATQTGLASGMVGFLLVGFSTSLPELSSVVAAVRIRRYEMAVGDVFGTNLFNIALIFLADAVYRGEPVLDTAGGFEVVGALLAVLMTGIFAIGLLERRDRTILRMGHDSLAAFATFALGVAALVMVDRG